MADLFRGASATATMSKRCSPGHTRQDPRAARSGLHRRVTERLPIMVEQVKLAEELTGLDWKLLTVSEPESTSHPESRFTSWSIEWVSDTHWSGDQSLGVISEDDVGNLALLPLFAVILEHIDEVLQRGDHVVGQRVIVEMHNVVANLGDLIEAGAERLAMQ